MNVWLHIPVYGVLLGLLYNQALDRLFGLWRRDDFNYGYIIVPIALYVIWEKRAELKRCPSVPSWRGMIPIGVGVFLYTLGELGGEYTTIFLSLWVVVIGLSWLHLGWRKMNVIAFPLAFSLVMFPPPNLIYSNVSLKLKLVSSRIGVAMLQMLGMSAFREGNIIDLGFTKLQVVDACSGLRYLVPLVALGILLAYHYRLSVWNGAVLVISAIPVTIVTNSLRLASVGVLYPIWGPKVAEGFFHDVSGWLIFMVGFAVLVLEVWALKKVSPSVEAAPRLEGGSREGIEIIPSGYKVGPSERSVGMLRHPHSVVAVLLLLATLLVFKGVNFREMVPPGKPFSQFPLAVGEWNGSRSTMERRFLDTLKLSDYSLVDYRDPSGREINLYVAYNESQRKGESTHSPDSCLPGSGWVFGESGLVDLPVKNGDGEPMRIARAVMQKSGDRQVAYYWFPQRGRILTNMYQLKIYTFWDALTKRRTDGALVRLITPVYASEDPRDAEARLKEFTRHIVPVLDGFIPGKEKI